MSKWSHLYTHSKWRAFRLRYLDRHPLCVMCEQEGRVTVADVVDHVTPHKGDMRLFWDESNLQPLCKRHHDSDKAIIDAGGTPKRGCDADGWPL